MKKLRKQAALAALALAMSACTTMQAAQQPLPALSPGPAQCLGVQAASTAWGLVDSYVRQTLQVQQTAACTPQPLPPAVPAPQAQPGTPPAQVPSSAEAQPLPNG